MKIYYGQQLVAAAATDTGSLWTVGIEDEFTLSVNGTTNSVTVTPGGISGNATDLAGLEAMFLSAWADKYGSVWYGFTFCTSYSCRMAMVVIGAGTFVVQSLQKDSGGKGLSVSIFC
jgi:hypothetical protein